VASSANSIERGPERAKERREYQAVRSHILFVFVVLLCIALAWQLRTVLELVYVSALFAVVLMPAVQQIMKISIRGWHPSRLVAIVGLVFSVLVLLACFLTLGLPPVLHDIEHFSADFPQHVTELLGRLKRLPLSARFSVDSLATRSEGLAGLVAKYLIASAPLWLGRVLDLLTAFILCIYFMLEGEFAYIYFLSFFPSETRDRLTRTMAAADQRISKWLLGQGALMLILGVTSTIVFALLHVRYFFMLGLLMGLFNIVPVIGGLITIVLAGCVAALDSWSKMAGVFIFYAIYTQIENAFLTPRIMRSSVNLMGLSVIVALLCGWELAGVVGALVAVPTAALVAVVMQEYMVQKDAEEGTLMKEILVQKDLAEAEAHDHAEQAVATAEKLKANVEASDEAKAAAPTDASTKAPPAQG
jgi:predicted PurR-regulated permease PerM